MDIQKCEAGFGPQTGVVRPRSVRIGRLVLVGVLALGLVAAPATSFAESKAGEVGMESGLGAAAAVSSLVYGPAKILYATGGLIVGAFAWAFTAGDSQVAEKVFTRSLRGNYVITPAMLRGEEELVFIGRDLETPTTSAAAVASAGPATQPYEEPVYDDMGW